MGGQALNFAPGSMVSSFALDSNSVRHGDLFLAIKGERVDGHTFVRQALERGAIGSVVERPIDGPSIVVPNLVNALALMARHYRDSFRGPVIGITGSAGKTTTKEFVASALNSMGPILKTSGNRNTEYTVPLLWADLTQQDRIAVVEMSMRGFDQVSHLASFSQPQIGLITNIGYAHMLQVGSREGIANAKGELLEALPESGVAILWHEDEFLDHLKRKTNAKILTFGAKEGADCQIVSYRPINWTSSVVEGVCFGNRWMAELPAVGRHIATNAAAAVLAAQVVGVDAQVAGRDLASAVLPPMRMEVIEKRGATYLVDTYNASPPSMVAAIETLTELPSEGKKWAVIGEMKELGEFSIPAHRSIGEALATSSIEEVILYGEATRDISDSAIRAGYPASAISTAQTISDVASFLRRLDTGDIVLIKGSRSLELERALEWGDQI